MIAFIIEWLKHHLSLFYWLGGISLLLFIITVVVVPLVLIYAPSDFLINKKRKERSEKFHFTIRILLFSLRILFIIVKNLIGITLIAAGILMLILPGQGIITILIGLVLVDFPGKKKVVFYILGNPFILNAINWIREKNRKKKLEVSGIKENDSV